MQNIRDFNHEMDAKDDVEKVSGKILILFLFFQKQLYIVVIECYNSYIIHMKKKDIRKKVDIMEKQIIISIGREFGSGGHEISEKLAKHYNIPLYDKEIFEHIEDSGTIHADVAKHFDEKPVNPMFYPISFDGKHLPLEQTVANYIFDFIRKKGMEEKESFVIVGRCAEYVLRENPNMISIFILGDHENKLKRVMEMCDLDEKAALSRMKKEDKMRKTYHNFYADGKWGDSRTYDLCVNSYTLGIDKTVEALISYIDSFMKK